MAATQSDVSRKLVISYAGGSDGTKTTTKNRIFSGLSETASADNILQAANALASLMGKSILNIYIRDTNEVIEQ